MATHSSVLAWGITWTEEPGRLWSMGSQKVRHTEWLSVHSQLFVGALRQSSVVEEEASVLWLISRAPREVPE